MNTNNEAEYYISATLTIDDEGRICDSEHICPTPTIACESELCILNPKGICLAPFLTGKPPCITDEGCKDCVMRNDTL